MVRGGDMGWMVGVGGEGVGVGGGWERERKGGGWGSVSDARLWMDWGVGVGFWTWIHRYWVLTSELMVRALFACIDS